MARGKPKDWSKNPWGAPTKYKEEFCSELVEYMKWERQEIYIDTTYFADWQVRKEENKLIANRFPTVARWCASKGINQDTFHEWVKQHPKFSESYSIAKCYQEAILLENGLQWAYNPQLTSFVLKNNHGYKDKTEVDQNITWELRVVKETDFTD